MFNESITNDIVNVLKEAIRLIETEERQTMCPAFLTALDTAKPLFENKRIVHNVIKEELCKYKPSNVIYYSNGIWFKDALAGTKEGKSKRLEILHKLLKQYSNNDRHRD